MAKFTWNAQKETAAVLLAEGKLGTEIATVLDVPYPSFAAWRATPEFKARVEENRAILQKEALSAGVANVADRVRRYNKRWNGINQVFEERATDPSHMAVPGWTTGLLVHEQKSLGSGELATVVDLYRVDVGAIKEEREIAKQAAQDLGQWTERTQQSYDLSGLTDEELEVLDRINNKLTKP